MEFMTLRISARTLNAIGSALQELPFKIAKPAIEEIDEQVQNYLRRKEQGNDRAKSGEIGDANGVGDGPDRSYVIQD